MCVFLSSASISLEKEWQPTPVFFPGKSHGQRNLVGYSPWGCKESATTKHISTRFGASTARQSSIWARTTLYPHLSQSLDVGHPPRGCDLGEGDSQQPRQT